MAAAQGQQLLELRGVWHWLPPGAAFFHKLIEGNAAILRTRVVERLGVAFVAAQAACDLDGDVFVNVPKLLDHRVIIGQALFSRKGTAKQVVEKPALQFVCHKFAKDHAQGIAAGSNLGVVLDNALVVQI